MNNKFAVLGSRLQRQVNKSGNVHSKPWFLLPALMLPTGRMQRRMSSPHPGCVCCPASKVWLFYGLPESPTLPTPATSAISYQTPVQHHFQHETTADICQQQSQETGQSEIQHRFSTPAAPPAPHQQDGKQQP